MYLGDLPLAQTRSCVHSYGMQLYECPGTNGAMYAMVTHDHVLLLLRLEMNFPDIFQILHHM